MNVCSAINKACLICPVFFLMCVLVPTVYVFNEGVFFNLQGTKCELKVKNGAVYEGVFKTYGPEVNYEHCNILFQLCNSSVAAAVIELYWEDTVQPVPRQFRLGSPSLSFL